MRLKRVACQTKMQRGRWAHGCWCVVASGRVAGPSGGSLVSVSRLSARRF